MFKPPFPSNNQFNSLKTFAIALNPLEFEYLEPSLLRGLIEKPCPVHYPEKMPDCEANPRQANLEARFYPRPHGHKAMVTISSPNANLSV